MRSWATEELKYAALPDKRLNKRLIKIVENLAQQPNVSIPQASGDWAGTKATYNLWKSARIESEDIIEPHRKQTAQRASKEKIILAIQDTSDFNFTHHQAKTESLGFGMTCAQKYVRGLKVHSIMASTTQGVPLGILEQQIWTRSLKKKQKKNHKAGHSILNLEIVVPRQDEKKSRTASLRIRHASFDFPPPINRAKSFQNPSVTLNVISALEDNPNPEVKPIQWLLLTTLEVSNFESAD